MKKEGERGDRETQGGTYNLIIAYFNGRAYGRNNKRIMVRLHAIIKINKNSVASHAEACQWWEWDQLLLHHYITGTIMLYHYR